MILYDPFLPKVGGPKFGGGYKNIYSSINTSMIGLKTCGRCHMNGLIITQPQIKLKNKSLRNQKVKESKIALVKLSGVTYMNIYILF